MCYLVETESLAEYIIPVTQTKLRSKEVNDNINFYQ